MRWRSRPSRQGRLVLLDLVMNVDENNHMRALALALENRPLKGFVAWPCNGLSVVRSRNGLGHFGGEGVLMLARMEQA